MAFDSVSSATFHPIFKARTSQIIIKGKTEETFFFFRLFFGGDKAQGFSISMRKSSTENQHEVPVTPYMSRFVCCANVLNKLSPVCLGS